MVKTRPVQMEMCRKMVPTPTWIYRGMPAGKSMTSNLSLSNQSKKSQLWNKMSQDLRVRSPGTNLDVKMQKRLKMNSKLRNANSSESYGLHSTRLKSWTPVTTTSPKEWRR